ncbi:MAG: DUF2079 domain-containing protein [Thermoplasmata archaeon]|nr:DUF2079 domain-containing protein [Thermoplasmata archaeon]
MCDLTGHRYPPDGLGGPPMASHDVAVAPVPRLRAVQALARRARALHGWLERPPLILYVGALVYVAVLTYLSWVRFEDLSAGTFDLGVKVQGVSTALGGGPVDTPDWMLTDGALGPSLFGIHFSPLAYAIAPLAAVLPPALVLFVLEWSALAVAALLVHKVARDSRLGPGSSLAISALFLVFPPFLMSGLYDFHYVSLFPALGLLLYLLLREGRDRMALGVLFLGACAQEGFLILAAFLAVQLWVDHPPAWRDLPWPFRWKGRARMALVVAVLASIGFVGELAFLRSVSPARSTILFTSIGPGFGPGAWSDFLGLKLAYWATVLALTGFLPVLGARRAVALAPPLVLFWFADNPGFSMFQWQYAFLLAPGLFLALVEGTAVLGRALRALGARFGPSRSGAERGMTPRRDGGTTRLRRRMASAAPGSVPLALIALLLLSVVYSPALPYSSALTDPRQVTNYALPANSSALDALFASVPTTSSVLASDYLFAHVARGPHDYPILVYGGLLGHLPPGFVPTYVLIFVQDAPWAHRLDPSFPSLYGRVRDVNATTMVCVPGHACASVNYDVVLFRADGPS